MRDPGFRVAPPPKDLSSNNFLTTTESTIGHPSMSTERRNNNLVASTPIMQGSSKLEQKKGKENSSSNTAERSGQLDPKYLQPSKKANVPLTTTPSPAAANSTGAIRKSSPLTRKPQSVYFN